MAARLLASEEDLLFLLCGEGSADYILKPWRKWLAERALYTAQPLERLNELLNLAIHPYSPQSSGAADLVMPSKLSGILASGRPVIVTTVPLHRVGERYRTAGTGNPTENPERLRNRFWIWLVTPICRQNLAGGAGLCRKDLGQASRFGRILTIPAMSMKHLKPMSSGLFRSRQFSIILILVAID